MPKKTTTTTTATTTTATSNSTTTPLIVRSSPFTGPTASAVNDSPIVQCARRKLQYSQLPVRCNAAGNKKSAPQLINSLKKFTPRRISDKNGAPGSEKKQASHASSGAGGRKKSMSMIDLSIARKKGSGDFEPIETRQENGSSSARLTNSQATSELLSIEGCWPSALRKDELSESQSRAAGLICRVLVVNAWRQRKHEIVELRAALTDATQQLDHLQLQIVVLRKLLDKENARVSSLAGELHRARAHNDELTKERDQLKKEKEAAETEARKEHEIVEEQSVTVENLRNELRSARDQVDTLDKQITRDREKLLKLREDKNLLQEKLSASEALAEERSARATKAELALEDAQIQLATQLAVTSSLQEEVQRCSNLIKEREEKKVELEERILKLEKENTRLEERLRLSEETERSLGSRAEYLECQLINQERKIRSIEAECNAHLTELKELRERVSQQSQGTGWSSRILQYAGSFIPAPSVVLRILAFFSSGLNLMF